MFTTFNHGSFGFGGKVSIYALYCRALTARVRCQSITRAGRFSLYRDVKSGYNNLHCTWNGGLSGSRALADH